MTADEPSVPDGAEAVDPARSLVLSDDEVRAALARADRTGAQVVPVGGGTSLALLMEAAAEAGLDPAEVRRAALVRSPGPSGALARTVLGASDRLRAGAHLPGAALPEERRELVQAAESATGRTGTVVEDEPGRFVWREDHTLGRTTLTAEQHPDGVEVSVAADRAGHYVGAWFGGLVGWAAAVPFLPFDGGTGVAAAALSFLVLPFLLARPFWVRSDRAARRRLEDTVMGVLRVVDRPARR